MSMLLLGRLSGMTMRKRSFLLEIIIRSTYSRRNPYRDGQRRPCQTTATRCCTLGYWKLTPLALRIPQEYNPATADGAIYTASRRKRIASSEITLVERVIIINKDNSTAVTNRSANPAVVASQQSTPNQAKDTDQVKLHHHPKLQRMERRARAQQKLPARPRGKARTFLIIDLNLVNQRSQRRRIPPYPHSLLRVQLHRA
jgi:hypothetical protein